MSSQLRAIPHFERKMSVNGSELLAGPDAFSLMDLPDDCMKAIFVSLALDDYHMLTLPLVCKATHRMCSTAPIIEAARLASRLRQVAALFADARPCMLSDSWALGHAWGALQAAEVHLQGSYFIDRASQLAAIQGGMESLLTICRHGSALEGAARLQPTLVTAEGLFLEAEEQKTSTLLARAERETALSRSDRAASDVAASLGLDYGGSRAAVFREAQQQALRHNAADTRRRWKLMALPMRRAWELKAAQANESAERRQALAAAAATIAKALTDRLAACTGGKCTLAATPASVARELSPAASTK